MGAYIWIDVERPRDTSDYMMNHTQNHLQEKVTTVIPLNITLLSSPSSGKRKTFTLSEIEIKTGIFVRKMALKG